MALAQGKNAIWDFEREADYGAGVIDAEFALRNAEDTLKLKREFVTSAGFRFPYKSETHRIIGNRSVEGSFKTDLMFEKVTALLLMGLRGSDTPSSHTGYYSHVIKVGGANPTFAIRANRDMKNYTTGDAQVQTFTGLAASKMTISAEMDKFVSLAIDCIGMDETNEDSGISTADLVASPKWVDFRHVGVTFNGSPLVGLHSVELSIDHKIELFRRLGNALSTDVVENGVREITGKIVVDMDATSMKAFTKYFVDSTYTATSVPIVITFVGDVIGATAQHYSMTFTMNKCSITGDEPQIKDDGIIQQTISFTALSTGGVDGGGLPVPEITVDIVNNEATL